MNFGFTEAKERFNSESGTSKKEDISPLRVRIFSTISDLWSTIGIFVLFIYSNLSLKLGWFVSALVRVIGVVVMIFLLAIHVAHLRRHRSLYLSEAEYTLQRRKTRYNKIIVPSLWKLFNCLVFPVPTHGLVTEIKSVIVKRKPRYRVWYSGTVKLVALRVIIN